ncbi:uncharacterized protein KGF55_001835 [Candida pseudojiufengensis]|uniref:uncharacterized protein n=1 Tax=Candida pseudojiufengensis TaxID=497109 RepID=UPI002223F053|nr:uncharacterized protein KGF55_001835 [Candida pseudojiufengensis]KAI5964765.1 hypothetical protein KGF55_001835 [Candida pseudojiufengensis]
MVVEVSEISLQQSNVAEFTASTDFERILKCIETKSNTNGVFDEFKFVLDGSSSIDLSNTYVEISSCNSRTALAASLRNGMQNNRYHRQECSKYRSFKNIHLAAVYLTWSKTQRNEFGSYYAAKKVQIDNLATLGYDGRGKPIERKLTFTNIPCGLSEKSFKNYIGYYNTERFKLNVSFMSVVLQAISEKVSFAEYEARARNEKTVQRF